MFSGAFELPGQKSLIFFKKMGNMLILKYLNFPPSVLPWHIWKGTFVWSFNPIPNSFSRNKVKSKHHKKWAEKVWWTYTGQKLSNPQVPAMIRKWHTKMYEGWLINSRKCLVTSVWNETRQKQNTSRDIITQDWHPVKT